MAKDVGSSKKGIAEAVSEAVSKVLVASMSHGQFPLGLLGLIALYLIFRLPIEDVSKLVFTLYNDFFANVFGYLLSLILLIACYLHSSWQRQICDLEVKRVSNEKTKLQERDLGDNLESSEEED